MTLADPPQYGIFLKYFFNPSLTLFFIDYMKKKKISEKCPITFMWLHFSNLYSSENFDAWICSINKII